MSGVEGLYIILLVICVGLSAFFSSSETAFISLQKIKLEHMVNSKVKGARLVLKMVQQPERLLSTILLGNNFVNTATAALSTALAVAIWGENGILIATLGATTILLIFGEITPKTIAFRHTEKLSLLFVRPIRLISWLLSPFVISLSWIVTGLGKLVGGTPVHGSLVTEGEIRTMISMGHKEGVVEKAEAEMLHKVFEFGDRPVKEIMVPRTEVVWIEKGTKLKDFLAVYAESPLSRFPVYKENRDSVIGILSIKDVLMAQAKGTIDQESIIDDLIRPPYFTTEYKRISELFTEMKEKNHRMAIVFDEYGGTAGIVSLTQLVEEIVGAVGDELAEVEKEYETINEYTFQIDGGMRIEEANEKMGLELPDGDYETVAGFVLSHLGHIPRQGEQLRYKELNLIMTKVDKQKIEEILLTKKKRAASTN